MLILGNDSVEVAMSLGEVRHRVRVDVRPQPVDPCPAGQTVGRRRQVLPLDDVGRDGRLAVGQWRLPRQSHRVAQYITHGQWTARCARHVYGK